MHIRGILCIIQTELKLIIREVITSSSSFCREDQPEPHYSKVSLMIESNAMEQTRMGLLDTNSPASLPQKKSTTSFKGAANEALQQGSLVNVFTGKNLL